MARTVEVPLEPGTSAAFEPYGQLIGAQAGEPVFYADGLRSWPLDYDVEGATQPMLVRYDYRPMECAVLERHFAITQCFIPLEGEGFVMMVAARTDADRSALPPPETVQAFLIEPRRGVLLWKGVWHALNRFPASPPGASFLLLTGEETQAELEVQLREGTGP